MMKKIIAGILVGVLIIGGVWLWKRSQKTEEKISSEITLESSKMLNDNIDLKPAMSEAEKDIIDTTFRENGVEMTMLKDVNDSQSVGTAWRNFDKKFNFKLEANRLSSPGKGFYYEGWLVGNQGFFSIGRLAEEAGVGQLYYSNETDKSEFKGVVVTLESEDGNAAPDKHILEGNF